MQSYVLEDRLKAYKNKNLDKNTAFYALEAMEYSKLILEKILPRDVHAVLKARIEKALVAADSVIKIKKSENPAHRRAIRAGSSCLAVVNSYKIYFPIKGSGCFLMAES